GRSASKSVMSSPCRYAVVIIDNCTRPAMKSGGGRAGGSMPWRSLGVFGSKHIRRRKRSNTNRYKEMMNPMPNRRKLSGIETAGPTLAELQSKLDAVRREVRNLVVMGMDPNQPPGQLVIIKQLERSARAELRLRTMALAHCKANLGRQRRGKN